MSVNLKTTRYGLSVKAGGWDPDGDSDTDQFEGCFDSIHTASCALTHSAEKEIAEALPDGHPALDRDVNGQVIPGRLKAHTLLKVTWPNAHLVQFRTFDDRAPENDPRLDLFFPWADDPHIPDFGSVTVV